MPSPTVSSGRLQSAESGLRCASVPHREESVWRLPSGVILPPRRYLSQFGVLHPDGSLKYEPRIVRGENGPLLVLVGGLSCYFQSKGKSREGGLCGRWLLTSFSPAGCQQLCIDEAGNAYDIGALNDAEKLRRLTS